ncbi:MASE3 domain-containing protein [Methanospirillum sp.]|uniref:MASE3 domain-containing protein n=1 Tax=Methanospirillum sp. TaxID=45200 RepID=UPI002B6EB3A1|nr:MASE3 domain-containing protein [Methanospirillum sp.]HPP77260.1 MASE3 domain-containing protein [Methanospirillum sp.]
MRSISSSLGSFVISLLVFIVLISLTAGYSYLLFHVSAEVFSIIIAGIIFVITWNSRDKLENGFLLFIGIAFFFIGSVDLLHTLAYKGMNIFTGYDANLPTQLWIASRYLEAVSLVTALLFINRRLRVGLIFWGYLVVTALLVFVIFARYFPDCYIEGSGLTPFKIISEYVICLILAGAMILLSKNKTHFTSDILYLLYGALIATIFSELAFTSYVSVYGPSNFLGHILKIIAFACMYQAIVVSGFQRPFEVLYREVSQNEKKYRTLFDTMDEGMAIFDLIDDEDTRPDYRFVDVNNRYASMMGRTPRDLIGRTGSEIYGAYPPPHLKQYFSVAKTHEPMRFFAYFKPDMKHYTVSVFFIDTSRIATLIADITPLKISERALVRANKKLSLLTQITRHDINNDLSLAYASLDLLKEKKPDDNEIAEYLGYLRESIDAINSKITFTRNYEQMGTQKPRWQCISAIINEICNSNIRFSSLKIQNSLDSLEIFADLMLPKVFSNLIDNSARHGKTVTTISLSFTVHENGCRILYEDDGVGISQHVRSHLFEPGYSMTHGFGLFLIKEILLLTGIEITEEGEEGKGVRFVLHVPPGGYQFGCKEKKPASGSDEFT